VNQTKKTMGLQQGLMSQNK